MLKELKVMEPKKQLITFILFIIGYFSPIVGLGLFIYHKIKKNIKLYQFAPLIGATIALAFFTLQFILYII